MRKFVFAVAVLLLATTPLAAVDLSPDSLWRIIDETTLAPLASKRVIVPKVYETVTLDRARLLTALAGAPLENSAAAATGARTLSLPTPDGFWHRYRVVESPIMEPKMAAKYPAIKTYAGQGIDDPTASLRFDITPYGFHAIVLSSEGNFFIDPFIPDDLVNHVVYRGRDFAEATDWVCHFESANNVAPARGLTADLTNGTTLKTYRLALAATGEYTQFHGGTVERAISRGMIPTMNRVNAVYGRELSVRMILVDNELIVFTDPTLDPYENNNPTALLAQNIVVCDALVLPVNFDIGHVFSTGGGGVALLGSVCGPTKGGGVTGTRNPIGDPYDIDYVAHEMGHQFGGNHTFNGSVSNCAGGNRNAGTAFEVGSGSTIQAYAGICPPQNLQTNSDDYFHWGSLMEISTFITSGGGLACSVQTPTGNTIPVVDGGTDFTIPKETPFTLTATGSDANGDSLTFCWEEFDLGPTGDGKTDNGSSPIFRSFAPRTDASRTFPRMSDILAGTTTYGEILPTTGRTLKFKVTARDNRLNGAFADDQVNLTVDAASGPFRVTSPNSNVLWARASQQTVTWDVANTNIAPVNTTHVNILISTDGGATFTTLASSTENDGSHVVTMPDVVSSTARIKVAAAGNVYFDVSDRNFHIGATGADISVLSAAIVAESCLPANGAIDDGETVTIAVTLKNEGLATANLTAALRSGGGVLLPSGSSSYGVIAPNATATREFTFTSDVACGGILTATIDLADGVSLGSAGITFVSGVETLATRIGRNINPMIFLVDPVIGALPGFGPASLYPSPITISGFTAPVTKVTATLRGIDHTFAEDLDILLAGPRGQAVMLMSDAGGPNESGEITLTFDDDAASGLTESALVSGTYKPTNLETADDEMPPQAPAVNAQTLSAFSGLDPNGVWNLYAADDTPIDGGTIYGGWALTIISRIVNCCDGVPVPPAGQIRFGSPTYTVGEDQPKIDVTVERVFGAAGTVTVNYATAEGTATAEDFTATSGTVTLADGQKSAIVSIPITHDVTAEPTEIFTVTLSAPTAGVLGSPAVTTVAITDDDIPCTPQPTGSFSDDFEPTPLPGWTVQTAANGTPAVPPWTHINDPSANSPTHSYFTASNPGDGGKDDRLISPPMAISSTSQLRFWHSYNLEETYDGGFLEVSQDGTNWIKLLRSEFVSGGYTGDSAGGDSWTGISPDYPLMNEVIVNVAAHAGNAVRFRWRMMQDSLLGTAGWAIDDVSASNLNLPSLPPVAADDSATTPKNQPVTINVVANDTDPAGDTLTVASATAGVNGGTTVVNPDGTITFTPAQGFTGTDTFAYTLRNSANCADLGTVSVAVTGVANRLPDAVNDTASTTTGQPVTINVLSNDSDPDNDPLVVTAASGAANGTVTHTASSVTYTPTAGFSGADTFQYTVSDGAGGTDSASVTVTVSGGAVSSTITSISPSTVCPGSAGFDLTVNGERFVSGSIVTFDGQNLATTFVSVNSLRATVPASLVASPRSASIAVAHANAASDNSRTLTVGDTTAPSVTAPAPITVLQTTCNTSGNGAASGSTSPTLASFLIGSSAADSCSGTTRLSPQANGADANNTTFFSAGTTTVTFRSRDSSGNVGTATSTITVRLLADLNLSNDVGAVDFVILANYLVGNVTPGDGTYTATLAAADLDRNGSVDAVDAVILANHLVGNITCLSN